MQNLEAQIIISALDRASKVFGGIGNSANTMVGRLGRAEQRISAFGVAAMASLGVSAFGVAGLVSSSVKAYAKWEDALADFGNTVNVHGAQLEDAHGRPRGGLTLRHGLDQRPLLGHVHDLALDDLGHRPDPSIGSVPSVMA